MAECLLKGGKMLDKTCPSCGSPLFNVKGETICVVCGGAQKSPAPDTAGAGNGQPGPGLNDYKEVEYSSGAGELPGDLREEVEKTIIHLCGRVRAESRPEDCLALMECIRIANEVLKGR